jgi:hypothetical protein
MTRRKLLWATLLALPLAVAGVVYGQALTQSRNQAPTQTESYTCPVTGEELPCPLCCPYSQQT